MPPDRPAEDPSSIQISTTRGIESAISFGFNSRVFQQNPPEAAGRKSNNDDVRLSIRSGHRPPDLPCPKSAQKATWAVKRAAN
jgi:hypothetical protein